MGVRSIFVSSGKRYAGNIVVLIYRRETILGELCIESVGSIGVLVEI